MPDANPTDLTALLARMDRLKEELGKTRELLALANCRTQGLDPETYLAEVIKRPAPISIGKLHSTMLVGCRNSG